MTAPYRLWALAVLAALCRCGLAADQPQEKPPTVWMGTPSYDKGRHFRELFERPDDWKETRGLVDVLICTDLNLKRQFTDEQLQQWLPQLQKWNIKLEMEVGAIKPWGETGEKTFSIEKPMWDRVLRLGGKVYSIAMDEPLCCVRKDLKKPDEYAVRETAAYIALVRKNYPEFLVGDIEPFPFIPLADHLRWIEALQKQLADMNVRGLDFYRLDVDWCHFVLASKTGGSWPEVRQIEQHCRGRELPFSLIYWAAGFPALQKKGLADDSTWYVSVIQQGYDYALAGGKPDQYVIESWVEGPAQCLPDSADFTFTRTVRDFARKFVKRGQ